MENNSLVNACTMRRKAIYHEGQRVSYKGEEAEIVHVSPVFTIKLVDKCHVVCGNIYSDIMPCANPEYCFRSALETTPFSAGQVISYMK